MKGPQLVHQHSVPQIAQVQHVHAQQAPVQPQPQVQQAKHVQLPGARVVMPFRQAGQPAQPVYGQAPVRVSFLAPPMQPPRKDAPGTPQARATNGYNHSQSHTPVGSHTPVSNGKSWPVTPYGRVPSPYVAAPEAFAQGWPKTQPVLSLNRRSSCILRPEVLSARREAPTGCSNPPHGPSAGAEPSGFPNLVLAKNDAGIIHVPDVRPSVQPMTDGTLLTVWPGLEDDSRDPPQAQKERGQLTSEEKLDYRELKFVEHLGSGEFGQVFRGFYKDQEVAVKQLYWDNTVLPQVIIQDLTREIESFRHLRHKRLVNFVGACLEIPNLCIVTEYAPGGSLHHLLHVRKLCLPLLHCTNMCLQLAEGVVYLHSQNPIVVHRDLKSLNVVLDLSLNIKLCDFGLTESMERTHITKKNNGGSPRYMAPELFDSKSKITEKVDIWSMGCIFTEINGGPLPYEGINTLAELTREMLVNRRTPSIPSSIPEPLEAVISTCYRFDSRLRPSARQVYEQLREAKKKLQSQGLLRT